MTAECGDREEGLLGGGVSWEANAGRQGAEHAELQRGEDAEREGALASHGEAAECEQLHGDGEHDGEQVQDGINALELASLDAAAGLQRLVELLDDPSPPATT